MTTSKPGQTSTHHPKLAQRQLWISTAAQTFVVLLAFLVAYMWYRIFRDYR